MSKVIVIGSQKGGVGKTTTTLNLAYSLCSMGKKVLAIDLDSQANLSTCYGIENTKDLEYTIGHLLMAQIEEEEPEELEHYIQSKDGVDFIPSSIYLSAVEAKLRTEMGAERMLAEVLAPIRDRYDYVLVDTAPSFGMLAWYFFTEDFASWSLSLSALLISPSVALIRLATSFLPRDSVSTPLSESHCFI
ncbi:AAA family ATPase [Blautia sp. MSJ-9]|uniref:ParA family protein n=1 Tax=Blautia sp. MSJ-9 TaxID=2841511 RepID=UPI002ED03734